MLQPNHSQLIAHASACRSVNGVSVRVVPAMGQLQLNAYYGYWFSHWRA
ncbi:hypothetical protein [Pseudomonas asturiensis]|nr:hypothetical protein [Pseudomonas asturiensis]